MRRFGLAAGALAVVVLAGCGGGDDEASATTTAVVTASSAVTTDAPVPSSVVDPTNDPTNSAVGAEGRTSDADPSAGSGDVAATVSPTVSTAAPTTAAPTTAAPTTTVAPEPVISDSEIAELERQLDEIDALLTDLELQMQQD